MCCVSLRECASSISSPLNNPPPHTQVLAGHFQEAKWSLTMAMGLLRMHNDRIQGADAVGLQAVQHDKARVFAHNDLVVPPWA